MTAKPSAYVRVARRDLQMASVRYRGLLPACALADLGLRVKVSAEHGERPDDATLALAVKPLLQRDVEWIRQAEESGVPTVVDLCDNIFIDGYGGRGQEFAERFVRMTEHARVVSVPTDALREIVIAQAGVPGEQVIVVPDIVETPGLLARQAMLLGQWKPWARLRDVWMRQARPPAARGPVLLWFGNHGATHGRFGLTDLLLFRDALAAAARTHRAELWVVSNHHERFSEIERELPITCTYFEWAPTLVDRLLRSADVCLVPNSLDAFSITKSPNRALKALYAGVPVVATPTRAYDGLEGCVWLGDPGEGIDAYLEDKRLAKKHVSVARQVLQQRYSLPALRDAMAHVVRRATSPVAVP